MKNILRLFFNYIISFLIALTFVQNVHAKAVDGLFEKLFITPSSLKKETLKEKIIYLTFDDGPSVVTNKTLDILKEKNVRGTFFVIGNQIKGFEDTIKRMNEEGHSIGLHTYSHKYKRIYRSSDAFIKEMIDCRNEINRVTGTTPNILRFPGGSRKRLSNEFLNKLHKNNFKVYDWNVQVSDGINPKTSPSKLFREATKETDSISPVILLMHCDYMHTRTCQALPKIIDYYKHQGYTFKAITEDTPEFYFTPSKKTFEIIRDILTSN